jgi:hypothetical protein
MAGINVFLKELKRARTSELDRIMEEWQRRISLGALTSIVLKTPVDTGRARGNWQAGTVANEVQLDIEDPSGGGAIDSGNAGLRQAKAFQPLIIWNNVEYINFLEEGSSTQAPQGMVALTVREIDNANNFAAIGLEFNIR